MMILDSSTLLRARLSAAVASVEPTFAFAWGDDAATPATGSSDGALNGTTNVTLVAAPAAGAKRIIRSGYVFNGDSNPVTLTFEKYDGTTARAAAVVTLGSKKTLNYGDNGFVISDNGGAGSAYDWIIALGDETTAITAGTKVTLRAPRPMTLAEIRASLTTAGSTATEFDVKVNGVSLFSTTPTIDATDKTSEDAAVPSVLATTAIAADDELTFIIVTAGTDAAGPKIALVGSTP